MLYTSLILSQAVKQVYIAGNTHPDYSGFPLYLHAAYCGAQVTETQEVQFPLHGAGRCQVSDASHMHSP